MRQTQLQTGLKQPSKQEETHPESEKELPDEEFEKYAIGSTNNLPEVGGFAAGPVYPDGNIRYVEYEYLTSPPEVKSEQPENGEISCNGIITGVSSYMDRYGIKEIEVPKYYSRFNEFDPIICKWTMGAKSIARGIEKHRLKGLVRMANGSGRIDTNSTHAILCNNKTFLVTGPRGAYFKTLSKIKPDETDLEPPESAYHNICGFDIPEESKSRRTSLKQFIEVINQYGDHSIVEYQYNQSKPRHEFYSDDGVWVRYAPSWLRSRQSRREILGTKESDYGNGYQIHIEPEDLQYNIGDEHKGITEGVIVGHRFRWETKEYIYSSGVKSLYAKIDYLIMCYNDRYDYHSYDFKTKTETLESFSV